MGTRNLTMVIQDHQTKVAQYGQWDGYPEGQGLTILSFLEQTANMDKLRQVLPKIRFENEKDIKVKSEFLQSMGAKGGWLNLEQAEKFYREYPLHSRDLGGAILSKLLQYTEQPEIVLVNAEDFASDSIYCEWAYVVDFDKNTLEVYRGSNQSEITPKDRFYGLEDKKSPCKPITIVRSFPLDKLPDAEKFISECYKERDRGQRLSKGKDMDQEHQR